MSDQPNSQSPLDIPRERGVDRTSVQERNSEVGGEIDDPPSISDESDTVSREPSGPDSAHVGGEIDDPPEHSSQLDAFEAPVNASGDSAGANNDRVELNPQDTPISTVEASISDGVYDEQERSVEFTHDDDAQSRLSESPEASSPGSRQTHIENSQFEGTGEVPDPEGHGASTGNEISQGDRSATDTTGARPDVPAEHPDLYTPSDAMPPHVDGAHMSPNVWAVDINPSRDAPDKGCHNCGECARAVQETWGGTPTVAASETQQAHDRLGEDEYIMDDWAGATPETASIDGIQEKLDQLGPGSSAIVKCTWDTGGSHYFNAVNDNGMITAVDGQGGFASDWPPTEEGVGYDSSSMTKVGALYFDSSGRLVK
jgi:hypothetical protein